jgi:hypothetical protein
MQDRNEEHANPEGRTMLLTTAKRTINEALYKDWEIIWTHNKHSRYLHSLGATPDKKTLKMHQHLPRALSSIITQMRTGKIGLWTYLHSINQADTSQCTRNQGEQTVDHVLLRCRERIKERKQMWAGSRPILRGGVEDRPQAFHGQPLRIA